MISLKKTIILICLLGILAAWYYVYEVQHMGKVVRQEEQAKQLFDFEKENMQELRVLADGEQTTLIKNQDTWEITDPVKAHADDSVVDSIITNLKTVKIETVVDENPADLKPFGLEPPRIQVGFKVKDAAGESVLNVGKQDPTKSGLYAKFPNQTKVFMISSGVEHSLKKKTFDLRDKKIIDVDPENVVRVNLRKDAFEATILNSGRDVWEITEPVKAKADKNMVRQMLNQIRNLRVLKFADEHPEGLAPYGLEHPAHELNIIEGKDAAVKTLLVGNLCDDPDGVYVKRASADTVVVVDKSFIDKIPGDVLAMRDKKIFPLDKNNVQVVELKYPDENIRIQKIETESQSEEKNPATTEENWEIIEPEQLPADRYSMSIFFSDLDRVLAEDFIGENDVNLKSAGLDNPQLQITVHEKNAEHPRILKIGNKAPEDKGLYALSEPVHVFCYILEKDLDNIKKRVFDFRNKTVMEFQRANVKTVKLVFPDRTIVFEVKNKKYKMLEPEKIVLNNLKVDDLLWSIDRIEMESIIKEPDTNLDVYGLLHPNAEITVETAAGETIGPLLLGKTADDEATKVFAKLKDQPEIFTVKKSIMTNVNVKPEDLQ